MISIILISEMIREESYKVNLIVITFMWYKKTISIPSISKGSMSAPFFSPQNVAYIQIIGAVYSMQVNRANFQGCAIINEKMKQQLEEGRIQEKGEIAVEKSAQKLQVYTDETDYNEHFEYANHYIYNYSCQGKFKSVKIGIKGGEQNVGQRGKSDQQDNSRQSEIKRILFEFDWLSFPRDRNPFLSPCRRCSKMWVKSTLSQSVILARQASVWIWWSPSRSLSSPIILLVTQTTSWKISNMQRVFTRVLFFDKFQYTNLIN